MPDIQPKSVRVIAKSTTDRAHRTVNIVTSVAADVHHSIKKHTQLTSAQVSNMPGVFETVQDSGGTISGLPTIFIPGYVGPN